MSDSDVSDSGVTDSIVSDSDMGGVILRHWSTVNALYSFLLLPLILPLPLILFTVVAPERGTHELRC